jgi:hypothetical protein
MDAAGSSLDWQNRGHSCRSAVNHRRASIPPEIMVLDPSCVSSTPQLKREQSLWPEFGWIHRNLHEPFEGICADISEFESYMPSQAVRSLCAGWMQDERHHDFVLSKRCTICRCRSPSSCM